MEAVFVLTCRGLSLVCLLATARYWSELIGITQSDITSRFDLAVPGVRLLYTTLSLVFPFAALGLWVVSRWGMLLFFFALGLEICAYLFAQQLFGFNLIHILVNSAAIFALAFFGATRFYLRWRNRAAFH